MRRQTRYSQFVPLVQDVLVTLDTITNANWQSNPPNWGLDRIDQMLLFNRDKPLDQIYKFDQTGHGTYNID
jgi:hypothetical protein